jgi:hypothetical protein
VSQRLQDALAVVGLLLRRGDGVARRGIQRTKRQDVFGAQTGDGSDEQCLDPAPLTDFARDLLRQGIVGRASHEPERLPDSILRNDVEIRRLLEIDGQRLPQRTVERRFARRVDEIREQDLVAVAKRGRPLLRDEHRRRNQRHDYERGRAGRDRAPPDDLRQARSRCCGRADRGRRQSSGRDGCIHVGALTAAVALQSFEVAAQIGRRLVAEVRILFHAASNDLFEAGGDLRVQSRRRNGFLVQDRVEQHR